MRKSKKKMAAIGLTCVLASGLLLGSVEYASHTFAATKVAAAGVQLVAEKVADNTKETQNASDVSKEETVYVTMDAAGAKQSVVVSDWLKNSGVNGTLKDVSDLTDIQNTKGNEKFTQDGSNVTWDTADKDIYYQGTTDKELPVGVEIEYELDGKKVEPKDLIGKSGKLKMTLHYTNTAKQTVKVGGEKKEVYTPFLMATGMILPVEKFTNVSIDNGQVLSEGENDIIMAYGMPGLKESLNLDDIDFGDDVDVDLDDIKDKVTDTVTITADVKDFELGQTYTMATSDIFKDIDLGKVSDTNDLEDKMDDLKDAANELVDGSDKIQSNLNKLDDNFNTYSDAIDTLNDSVKTLDDGSQKINKATDKYTKSADKLLGAVNTYTDGAKTFAKSTKKYTKNTKKLIDGVGQLYSASSKFPTSYKEFDEKLDAYTTGVNTLLSEENMTSLTGAAKTLKNGVETVDNGLKQVQAGVKTISEGASALDSQKENADTCIQALSAMQKQYEALAASESDATKKAQYQQMAQAAAGSIAYMQGAEKLASSIAASTNGTSDGKLDGNGAKDLAAALAQIEAATNTESKEQNLYTGLEQLGQSADLIAQNAETLRGYKEPLMTASTTIKESISTITSKLDLIYKNGKLLTANNKKLESAADAISSNAGLIKKNSKKLTASSGTFRKATKSLATGTGKLVSGVKTLVTSTDKVSDGIGKLADGAVDLYDGMKTFKKDGTDRITDTISDLLDNSTDLEDRVKALDKASKNYTSFSGVSDEMAGSVKFIMTTEELKADE